MKVRDMAQLMGKVVNIKATLHRKVAIRNAEGEIITGRREWVIFAGSDKMKGSPRYGQAGWVVGFRQLQNGRSSYEGDEVGHVWCADHKPTIPCMLVALKPNTTPVKVPLDGYTLGGTPDLAHLFEWTEQDRKNMRETMAIYPRDKKGRWMK